MRTTSFLLILLAAVVFSDSIEIGSQILPSADPFCH